MVISSNPRNGGVESGFPSRSQTTSRVAVRRVGTAGEQDGTAAGAGAPHLRVDLSETRIDDKHVRAVEFELSRGRYRAIVTAKSRGEVTLVGPFRTGKVEGPCASFPFDAGDEVDAALGDFLTRFLEEAATP